MSTNLKSSSSDPRTLRTRAAFREAFIRLTAEHGFERVTVREIARLAGTNRATFYRHYVDKWDLVTSWVAEAHAVLQAEADSLSDPRSRDLRSDYLPTVAVAIFEHIAAHAPLYRLMIGRNAIPLVANELERQIEAFVETQIKALHAQAEIGMPLPIYCRSNAAGFVGIIRWWLEHDLQYTPVQMATWVWRQSQYPDPT